MALVATLVSLLVAGALLAVALRLMTRLQRAHRRLEERERTYRLLADNVSDVIWTADTNLRFKFVSPSITRLVGYGVEEALVARLDHVLTPASTELAEKVLEEELAAHNAEAADPLRSRVLELEFNHKDGSGVPAEVKVTFLRGPDCRPVGILGVARDISERKRAEAEKAELQLQLLQAQKMEAIGTLAGGVAHDFNNLLVAILGYSELMLSRLDDRDPLRNDIEEIRLAGERAAWLTRQLLAFSRKQVLHPEPLDLNTLVQRSGQLLRRLIGEDIDLMVIPARKPARIRGDRWQIEQVIMNLAVNARDAMPDGGRLVIRTETVTIDGKQPHPAEAQPGEFVCLSVADTGSGIDQETVQRIFEPFFTTKDADNGTGLGLSVVHGIVKQHGGWITVQSQPEHGATFGVYLPVCPAEIEGESTTAVSTKEFRGNGERILLLEDESGVRRLTSRVLRESGYAVFDAADADEAKTMFRREGGRFDLVFSDVVLPRQNGLRFVDELRSTAADIPILLTSGYADREQRWHDIKGNGFRFLQKPYDMAEMLRAVREAIGRARDCVPTR